MLNSILGSELTLVSFLICTAVSLLLGVGTALVSMYRSRTTQSFAVTLAILPAVVQLVIMLVNGNLGAGYGYSYQRLAQKLTKSEPEYRRGGQKAGMKMCDKYCKTLVDRAELEVEKLLIEEIV